jgi:lipid A 3-O-deacylase
MKIRRSLYTLALGAGLTLKTIGAAAQTTGIPEKCEDFNALVDQDERLDQRDREKIKSSSSLSHTFIWENDSFAAGGDFNYTNGMKLSWLHNPCRHRYTSLKGHYKGMLASIFHAHDFRVHSGGLFGMNMYTPNNLNTAARITTDRPYAGWLYGGISVQATRELDLMGEKIEQHQLELQVGITGPKSLQREAQEYIHRNITDSDMPLGWDNQIGQRIGVNALYGWRRDFYPQSRVRVVPHAGFSLGNLVQFVNGGGMVLIGNSGGDYPGTTLQPIRAEDRMLQKTAGTSIAVQPGKVLYGFVGVDARYVFNSVFVEGFDESAHNIELIHGVYDVIGGVAWGNHNVRLSYKVVYRSKEFHSPDPTLEKSHRFGQFSVSWFF